MSGLNNPAPHNIYCKIKIGWKDKIVFVLLFPLSLFASLVLLLILCVILSLFLFLMVPLILCPVLSLILPILFLLLLSLVLSFFLLLSVSLVPSFLFPQTSLSFSENLLQFFSAIKEWKFLRIFHISFQKNIKNLQHSFNPQNCTLRVFEFFFKLF